ncbi:MAG: CYTH and CHAD domain-containing protein, partial [Jatrophihabitantaceae bacterium]
MRQSFDLPDDWNLPELTDLVPADGALVVETQLLECSDFDTARHDLRGHGLHLRRQSGVADAGWHLTGPSTAIDQPLAGRGVPPLLRAVLLGVRGGSALTAVARTRTERVLHRIVDADGAALLELAVDDSTATAVGEPAGTSRSRQVSIRVGRKQLRRQVVHRLEASGAWPPALAAQHPTDEHPSAGERRPTSLAGLLTPYLTAQYGAIVAGDLNLRAGRAAVHETRIATRRYRTVLHEFAPRFVAERALALDQALSWYADLLGAARDLEIVRAHLSAAADALAPELVLGPVAARIDESAAAALTQAQEQLDRALRSRRYFALLAE